MRSGVTIVDPASTWVDVDVRVGADTTIYPGTCLRGTTRVGDNCEIGPNATLIDAEIGGSRCGSRRVDRSGLRRSRYDG